MNFDYTDEQQLLADSLRRFIDRAYAFETRRKIVASSDGYSREVWAQFADMGLLGLPLPAKFGGFGGSTVDLVGVMDAFGEALIVEPYLPTMMTARLVMRSGTPAQMEWLLPPIASGQLIMAFAHTERNARYNPSHVTATARKTETGYRIDGDKCVVLGAPSASMLIVSARTSGHDADRDGIGLFLIDATTPGVVMKSYRTLDELRAADVTFRNVAVPADAH